MSTVNSYILEPFRYQWQYTGKVIGSTRFALKSAAAYNPGLDSQLANTVNRLGLASIVNVLLHQVTAIETMIEGGRCVQIKDFEGATLACATIISLIGDSLDSFYTFGNAFDKLFGNFEHHKVLAERIIDLNLGLVAIGLVMRIWNMYQTSVFLRELEQTKDMNAFLKKHCTVLPSEIKGEFDVHSIKKMKEKKVSVLERKTSPAIAKALLEAQENNKAQLNKVDIETFLKRKISLGHASLTTNLVTAIGLQLFRVAAVPPHIPLAIISITTLARLLMIVYQNFKLSSDLKFLQ